MRAADPRISTAVTAVTRPPLRPIFANLALVGVAGTLALCALEGLLRLVHDPAPEQEQRLRRLGASPFLEAARGGLRRLKPDHSWGIRYPSDERGYFLPGNVVRYQTNAEGFRDRPFDDDPSSLRIALLGDSFAFGLGVHLGDTAAVLLEGLLGASHPCPVEIYNFAVPGTATHEHVRLLEDSALKHEPDMILLWYFLNDVEAGPTLSYLGADEPPGVLASWRRVSALARFIGTRIDSRRLARHLVQDYTRAYRPTGERWQVMVASLRRIADIARRRDIPAVLAVHPILHDLDRGYPFADIHRRVLTAARAFGFAAFDLRPAFRGYNATSLWVHPIDQHPNELAQRLAAEHAAARLRTLLPPCRPTPSGR